MSQKKKQTVKMVQEHTYSANTYVDDAQARRSTYKAMQMGTYNNNPQGNAASTRTKAKKANPQVDVWGSVFKNKEHFVNMHLC